MAKMKLTADHKRYHKWVMEYFGCQVPKCLEANTQFHHVYQPYKINQRGGVQLKPTLKKNHWYGVSLCQHHHAIYHDQLTDFDKYEKKYGIDQVWSARHNLWCYKKGIGK